jgi:hypothetical protein
MLTKNKELWDYINFDYRGDNNYSELREALCSAIRKRAEAKEKQLRKEYEVLIK